MFATYLFKFYFIKILGGLLLIWIVNDLRKDLVEIKKVKKKRLTVGAAIGTSQTELIRAKNLIDNENISQENLEGYVGKIKRSMTNALKALRWEEMLNNKLTSAQKKELVIDNNALIIEELSYLGFNPETGRWEIKTQDIITERQINIWPEVKMEFRLNIGFTLRDIDINFYYE